MSDTVTNILFGAHKTLSLGPYVTAKGAGTLVEVGATDGGVKYDPKPSYHEQYIDRRLGAVKAVPIKSEWDWVMKLIESTIDNWVTAFHQPTANKSGTTPNFTLLLDMSAQEIYYQAQLVVPGLGTTATRTLTAWRCWIKALGSVEFKKDAAQGLPLTIGIAEETTGSGVDSVKLVES